MVQHWYLPLNVQGYFLLHYGMNPHHSSNAISLLFLPRLTVVPTIMRHSLKINLSLPKFTGPIFFVFKAEYFQCFLLATDPNILLDIHLSLKSFPTSCLKHLTYESFAQKQGHILERTINWLPLPGVILRHVTLSLFLHCDKKYGVSIVSLQKSLSIHTNERH